MREIPQSYDAARAEREWADRWERDGLYRYDPSRSRAETFAVDTPPLTVSGSLHIGHAFSFTQADVIVRQQRMNGKNICYPIGWDDNGLATERRVQNVFGIRPDPRKAYDPTWKPTRERAKDAPLEEVSRRNFIEACAQITAEDERAFEEVWRRIGLSVDWTSQYATIDEHCRRASQLSFLDLVARGEVYQKYAPTTWDVDDRTAVAQAEVEDREMPGAYHDLRFAVEGGGEFTISTTRPELLGACVAVVAHPSDARYQAYFGRRARTPLFHALVPILASEHADPEKGTGILMVCTFGDQADVEFWKGRDLPLRQLIGSDGRMRAAKFGEAPFESADPAAARQAWSALEGKTVKQAQAASVELLRAAGALAGEPRPITHAVKYYERGSRPLEFVPTRQWFIRLLQHKEVLLEQGRKIEWRPGYMRARYENWVQGLNQDWCVSRQRYSGVPFPVWYPLGADGAPDYERPIFAAPGSLPVDPMSATPPGYRDAQRDQPGGFAGDPDVMDTWATSSLTPQIVSRWPLDPERHAKLFPMDMRPQSHEIIRTWAFYTIVKAWMHERQIPWRNVVVSGWILDPDRKKMSKSKGNVVTPMGLFETHSVDAVRYWAARARLGVDTALDEQVMKLGRRLATKLANAGRFVLLQLERVSASGGTLAASRISHPLDVAFAAKLAALVERATRAYEEFEFAPALQACEETFWDFCDNYLEIVKVRAYAEAPSAGRDSALATLELALRVFLRLFAPVMPYVTEEVWSWRFAGPGRERSIHTSAWPSAQEFGGIALANAGRAYDAAREVSAAIRGAKTSAKKSLRWPVARLEVRGGEEELEALRSVLSDVLGAGSVDAASCRLSSGAAGEGTLFATTVELSEQAAEPGSAG
ncbi:MAG: valine--tRNA ligase [Deltaproteobacteria bacterium]|nr:valine--tRNA ligase [Deltaproteobacteria bacterium]